jgi:hypothetical protein
MVDYSKHHEFKTYLSNLNIETPIKYFEIVNNDSYSTYYHYYLELDESFVEKLNKYDLYVSKIIIPVEDNYIQMICFQLIQNQGVTYGGEVMRANQSFIMSHLREKKLLTLITPNCKQGSNGWDLINEIGRNQEFYFNEMKKKNIITELNDINENYCNKINNLESKLEEQLNKNNELEKILKNFGSDQKDKMIIEILQSISFLREMNDDTIDKLKHENTELKVKLNKKDKLNKRLINILKIYKYHEFNNVEKYDYNEIKQKNKTLNSEFKRVAKLMKLC